MICVVYVYVNVHSRTPCMLYFNSALLCTRVSALVFASVALMCTGKSLLTRLELTCMHCVPCSYAYSLKNTMMDEKVKDKIDATDKSTLEAAVNKAISWLESNPAAEKEEYEAKQKELEGVAMPIMTKM